MLTEHSIRSDLTALIHSELESLLQTQDEEQAKLYEAARYAVLGPGKKIRPLLCLAAAEMLDVPLSQALIPAAALELVHCYSLIHDDLPAMDNDDYRRGRLTLHRAFPEGLAILTGDYLLTYAFEVLSRASLDDTMKIRLIQILAHSAGSEGMVGGQVRDIASEKEARSLHQLQALHQRKTGGLFKASILFAGILGNVSQEIYAILEQIGEKIGLAFQIADDIIDITKSEEKHGRSVSSDISNQKTTYATLLGISESKQKVHQELQSIDVLINTLSYPRHHTLKETIHWAISRCL